MQRVSNGASIAPDSQAKSIHWSEFGVIAAVAFIVFIRLISYYDARSRLSVVEIALKLAESDAEVKHVLGEPIRSQGPATAEAPDSKEANLSVAVYGPQGRGTLRIFADRGEDSWVFSRLEFFPQDHPEAAIELCGQPAASKPEKDGSYLAFVVRVMSKPFERPQLSNTIQTIKPTLRHDTAVNEFELNLQTGVFVLRQTDIFIPGSYPIALTRTYRSFASYTGGFGKSAAHPYEIWPTGTRNPYTEMNLNLEDGSQIYYSRISAGTGYTDAVYRHDQTSSEFYASQIFWNGDGWTLRLADLRKILFPEAYNAKTIAQSAPIEMDDAAGNRILLQRDSQRNLQTLVSAAGRKITFNYNDSGQIVEAKDDQGHSRRYKYEPTSHIGTVLDGEQPVYRFAYERLLDTPGFDSFAMTEISDGAGREILRLVYDRSGRVVSEKLAGGETFQFEYGYINDNGSAKQETIVIPPSRKRSIFIF